MVLKFLSTLSLASTCVLATSLGVAPPCTSGTLAAYLALPPQGCTIADDVKVADFFFNVIAAPAVPATPADIQIDPVVLGGGRYGLLISSAMFSVSGFDAATYEIRYVFDPADIRSMEDVMTANSPVFPGTATVVTEGCIGAAFVGAVCPGPPPVQIMVFHNGNASQLTDATPIIPPQSILGIRHIIDLQANGASSQFDSLLNTVTLPEPSSWLLVLGGSVLLGLRARRR